MGPLCEVLCVHLSRLASLAYDELHSVAYSSRDTPLETEKNIRQSQYRSQHGMIIHAGLKSSQDSSRANRFGQLARDPWGKLALLFSSL